MTPIQNQVSQLYVFISIVVIPIIAVAQEHQIYYYKDYSPFLRFDLPSVEFSQEEKDIWRDMASFESQE